MTLQEHPTGPGQALGTVAYMSPEQVRARELDLRTDLFSFGAVLYEMTTGALPFPEESSGVISKAILDAEPMPVLRLNRDLPPKLEEIIDKCLEKDRDLPYQHAADIRADLQQLKRDTEDFRYRLHRLLSIPCYLARWKQNTRPIHRYASLLHATDMGDERRRYRGTTIARADPWLAWLLVAGWQDFLFREGR